MQQLWGFVIGLVGPRARVLLGFILIGSGFALGGNTFGFALTILGALSFWTGTCGRCMLGSCPTGVPGRGGGMAANESNAQTQRRER